MRRAKKETALVAVKPVAASLYKLEHDHQAFLDTEEMVAAEQRAEFEERFKRSFLATRRKRDRTGKFIQHCQTQAAAAKAEAMRLLAMADLYERAEERIKQYLTHIILSLGPDEGGHYRRLDGQFYKFWIQRGGSRVEPRDERQIPPEFKRVTVEMDGDLWQHICESFPGVQVEGACRVTTEVRKSAIRAVLDQNRKVPGAELGPGGFSLRMK